ncbi:MAG: hypothetical protein LBV51_00105 [Acholeplasmatales bacterium]|jgi:hypothetical protein|nr:hypothetical protein [Acholeplasmatales bacterium]
MNKKQIIKKLKEENNNEVTYNPNFNALASILNIPSEEDIFKTKQNQYHPNPKIKKMFYLITYSLLLILAGFLTSYLIFSFKYESTNPSYTQVQQAFIDNNATQISKPIVTAVNDNYFFAYIYLGVTNSNKNIFVFEADNSFYIKVNDSETLYFSYDLKNRVNVYVSIPDISYYTFKISTDSSFDSNTITINIDANDYAFLLSK